MTTATGDDNWRKCSICKAAIGFGRDYFACSVSTCNRKRTGLFFCSLPCFEAHLPEARHRDAWAEPTRAPSRAEWDAAQRAEAEAPESDATSTGIGTLGNAASGRRVVAVSPAAAGPERAEREAEHEILVVVSKLKKYVRDWSGMNTSDAAMNILSDHLRELCREAVRKAGQDGRRTLLDRDFVKVIAELQEGRK